jgi:hypothetical protein
MKARILVLITFVSVLFTSCKKNIMDANPKPEIKTAELNKQEVIDYVLSKRVKGDHELNSSIDTVLSLVNWSNYKIVSNTAGKKLTILEMSNIMEGKLLMLLYSENDKQGYQGVQLASVNKHPNSLVNEIDAIAAIYKAEKVMFSGSVSYFKITKEFRYELGYEDGKMKFSKILGSKPKPSTSGMAESGDCYDVYLITYWSDGSTSWNYIGTICAPSDDCDMQRTFKFASGTTSINFRCGPNSGSGGGSGGGDTNSDAEIVNMFFEYCQMESHPVTKLGSITGAGQTPISDIITWDVAKHSLGTWRIIATTQYSYTHERFFTVNTTWEDKYNMTTFNTTGSSFVGSNVFIETTWNQTSLISEILNNNTSGTYGRSKVSGTVRHRLRQPLPVSGGLLDYTFPVPSNELHFYPR